MRNQLLIDGNDIGAIYGLTLLNGSCNDIVEFPPLKAVKSNDWHEEDGIEADLDNPVLNTHEVSMRFAEYNGVGSMDEFLSLLSDKAYHTFKILFLNRSYRLRLVSTPRLEWKNTLGFVTFKFADDFPLDGYDYLPPVSSIGEYRDYALDDRYLTDYGVRILQGTLESIDRKPDVKPNLLRNLSVKGGAQYDDSKVTYKSKDVQLKCLMRANTLDEFWRNHDALLYDLIRPNVRELFVAARNKVFPFHYKSCKTVKFYPTEKIWWEFTLTLTFVGEGITPENIN